MATRHGDGSPEHEGVGSGLEFVELHGGGSNTHLEQGRADLNRGANGARRARGPPVIGFRVRAPSGRFARLPCGEAVPAGGVYRPT